MNHVNMKQVRTDYELLSFLDSSDIPLGATTLVLSLGARLGMSQASIGRKLMEFDEQGLTRLKGRKGRVLTAEGKRHLNELKQELTVQDRNSSLLAALNTNDEKNLIDVLISRRALERENAYLAAMHASPEDLESLGGLIAKQHHMLAKGIIPIEEDEHFHMAIARISRNRVLYHALRLVWSQGMTPHLTSNIRHSVGSRLIVDHEKIFESIKARDPEASSAAMTDHINQIIHDVKTYFKLRSSAAGTNESGV